MIVYTTCFARTQICARDPEELEPIRIPPASHSNQRPLLGRHVAEFGIFKRGTVKAQRDRSQPLGEKLVGAKDSETGAFLSTT
jgi:hypothetical protein